MKSCFAKIWIAALCALSLGGCIRDGLNDCKNDMNVVIDYSYNLASENLFEEQADIVTLFIFDDNDILLYEQTDRVVHTGNYRMSVPAVPEGKYSFSVIARSDRVQGVMSDFEVPDLKPGVSVLSDLHVRMKRDNGIQDSELNDQFINTESVQYSGQDEIRIGVKKINTKIVVRVYSLSAEDLPELDVKIFDDPGNGIVNYDFSLLPDEGITYLPYEIRWGEERVSKGYEPGSPNSVMGNYMNTSRLTIENNPYLSVTQREGGEVVFDQSLIKMINLLRDRDIFPEWELQEYLDRLDECVISIGFESGSGGGWLAASLVINGWVINLNDIDM